MRVWRPGQSVVDVAVSVAAALVTAAGTWGKVAPWLPHVVIVPLAVGQGLLLLARRRAPVAVLAAVTPLGVFMLAVGYPALAASAGMYCAAYAVGFHGRGGERAELTRTLHGAAAALIAACALAVAAVAPGARNQGGAWNSFSLGALVAACWVLGYALRMRRDYVATRRDYVAELRDRPRRRSSHSARNCEMSRRARAPSTPIKRPPWSWTRPRPWPIWPGFSSLSTSDAVAHRHVYSTRCTARRPGRSPGGSSAAESSFESPPAVLAHRPSDGTVRRKSCRKPCTRSTFPTSMSTRGRACGPRPGSASSPTI
ncbi:MAG: DUF7134 domain-containing protein [Trebonia sp.]